jgi:hypothetical protein
MKRPASDDFVNPLPVQAGQTRGDAERIIGAERFMLIGQMNLTT